MTEHNDDLNIPDTGFKLRPLIQSALRESQATELDELALEILGKIADYDRETALFQAVRALARETWRPAFIPTPRDAAPEVPQPVTPSNPPPERDGRQWLTPEGAVLDDAEAAASWQERHDEAVASAIESEAAEIVEDEKAKGASEEEATAKATAAARVAWERASQTAAINRQGTRPQRSSLLPSRPPTRPLRSATPPPRPKESPKVAAIREAWQRALTQRIATEHGHKFLRDCTIPDLEFAASQREQHAKRVEARAADLRRLAEVMREHQAERLMDVPAEVLSSMSDTLSEAAA